MRILPVLFAVVLLGACEQASDPQPMPSGVASDASESATPDGWRRETYRGVEVSVPDTWGWGNGSQRIDQWCVDRGGDRDPIVGRPGLTTLVACLTKDPALGPPETLIVNTGVVVAFEDIVADDDPARLPRGGDRLVRDVNGVRVIIQAPGDERDRIAGSLRTVDADANGCPVDDPIAQDPTARPNPVAEIQDISGVTGAVACRYALDGGIGDTAAPPLLSSRALTPKEAVAVVDGVAAAPVGGGPDDPSSCSVDVAYGDEAIVLRIEAESGDATVHVRYAGCDHHGFDDGTTRRRITRAPLQPLIVDANVPFSFDGVMADVLGPPT